MSVFYIWAEVHLPTGNPVSHSNPPQSSALLYHGTSRGGVQLFLDESETWTQFKYVPERWGKTGSHKEEVPQAGPSSAILLEHKRQFKRGHHSGVVHNAFQPLAALLQLQVDVEDAATQAAGLTRCQTQDFPSYPSCELLRYQHRGAVQRCLLGSRQAVLKHLGQLLTGSVFRDICTPLGLSQAVIPEIQFWGKQNKFNIEDSMVAFLLISKHCRTISMVRWQHPQTH